VFNIKVYCFSPFRGITGWLHINLFCASLVGRFLQQVPLHREWPPGFPERFLPERIWLDPTGRVLFGAGDRAYRLVGGRFEPAPEAALATRDDGADLSDVASRDEIRQVARRDGAVAAATGGGLFERVDGGPWGRLAPRDPRGLVWGATDVRGVAYDAAGRLVVATPAGIARRREEALERREGAAWEFFTGAEGLPVADFTAVAAAPDGRVSGRSSSTPTPTAGRRSSAE
jgi:hypothetical protein